MAVDDEDLVFLRGADFRQSRVGARGAVFFDALEAGLEAACVGEGEGLRDLDDEGVFYEFELFAGLGLVREFGVFERLAVGDAAEDLDAGAGGVPQETEQGEGDADEDADAEVPEEGGEEDEEHQEELRVA